MAARWDPWVSRLWRFLLLKGATYAVFMMADALPTIIFGKIQENQVSIVVPGESRFQYQNSLVSDEARSKAKVAQALCTSNEATDEARQR